MTHDPRLTPSNGRVAHVSLRGKVKAERFVEGDLRQAIDRPFLYGSPDAERPERQLVWGDRFRVLEWGRTRHFGQAEKDGYCGYVPADGLTEPQTLTHRVTPRFTWAYPSPDMKQRPDRLLSLGAGICATSEHGKWAEIEIAETELVSTGRAYLPLDHLRPADRPENDPVAVAERLLGTPYLWAGNSGLGIDCSGLVQAALLACGIPCPGDSDLQEAALGEGLGDGETLRRGDLLFWKGHVAMCRDATTIIHATAAFMQVVIEDRETAIARIAASGDGAVTARKRLGPARNL